MLYWQKHTFWCCSVKAHLAVIRPDFNDNVLWQRRFILRIVYLYSYLFTCIIKYHILAPKICEYFVSVYETGFIGMLLKQRSCCMFSQTTADCWSCRVFLSIFLMCANVDCACALAYIPRQVWFLVNLLCHSCQFVVFRKFTLLQLELNTVVHKRLYVFYGPQCKLITFSAEVPHLTTVSPSCYSSALRDRFVCHLCYWMNQVYWWSELIS